MFISECKIIKKVMARSILQAIFLGLENMFYSFSPRICFLLLVGNPNASINSSFLRPKHMEKPQHCASCRT